MTKILRSPIARVLLLAALMGSMACANAREVRMQGPGGSGGVCPDAQAEPASVGGGVEPATPAQPPAKGSKAREKAKAAPMVRSAGDNTARPRWHSILPGMFR